MSDNRGESEIEREVKNPVSKPLPYFKRLKQYSKFKSSSRALEISEYGLEFPGNILNVTIYVSRKPIYVFLSVPDTVNLIVKSVKFIRDSSSIDLKYGIRYLTKDNMNIIEISPSPIEPLDKILIEFEDYGQPFDINTRIIVVDEVYMDKYKFDAAFDFERAGQYEKALEKAQEYYQLCPGNPHILQLMATLYFRSKNMDRAFENCILTAVAGLSNEGTNLYRQFAQTEPFLEIENIREIQEECSRWNIDRHYGIVSLLKEQKYLLGLNGCYVRQCREVYEIRRPSAARMFNRLGFRFSNREYLLFTDCRIINKGDRVYLLPAEQLVISDSTERNIYITVEEDKEANFLLPELSAGDIIEMTFHLLYWERYKIEDDQPHVFILTQPHHITFPVFKSGIIFKAPLEWNPLVEITQASDDVVRDEYCDESHRIAEISLKKYIPSHQVGCIYESFFRNPAVAYCTINTMWQAVGQKLIEQNFGSLDIEDKLPAPLLNIVDNNHDKVRALQKSFYYIRDKIKYASVRFALKEIGREGRAQAIFDSGVADCKDKSYLLYQVCRKLGLQSEYVFVSTVHGKIFKSLPSDQFDHVFVRVLTGDKYLYLDAASRTSVFGTSPSPMQGVPMLVIGKESSVEYIPCSPPENNHLSITETFDSVESDLLAGSFHIRAEGNVARYIDENLKWQTLQETGFIRSSQIILRDYMPSTSIKSYDRISHTANSDVFEILGTHNRCRLILSNDHYFGILNWNDPYIPLNYWRSMKLKGYFTFTSPHIIDINVVLGGNLAGKYSGNNIPLNYQSDICDIFEDIHRGDDNLSITRKIIIKRKFITKELISLFPEAMENIEKAFQLALIFNK